MKCNRCGLSFIKFKPRYPKIQNFAANNFLCKNCYNTIEEFIDGSNKTLLTNSPIYKKDKNMLKQVRYNCIENDNHIIFTFDKLESPNEIDELQIGNSLEKEWTVISFNDLVLALNEQGYNVLYRGNII